MGASIYPSDSASTVQSRGPRLPNPSYFPCPTPSPLLTPSMPSLSTPRHPLLHYPFQHRLTSTLRPQSPTCMPSTSFAWDVHAHVLTTSPTMFRRTLSSLDGIDAHSMHTHEAPSMPRRVHAHRTPHAASRLQKLDALCCVEAAHVGRLA
jgi:hypothetical protein